MNAREERLFEAARKGWSMDTDLARECVAKDEGRSVETTDTEAPTIKRKPSGDRGGFGECVFAFRLSRADRDALKAAALRAGFDRKHGGVTEWARANLVALADQNGGGSLVVANDPVVARVQQPSNR